ncbi:MAG: hypothetical protein ACREV7_12765 [Steroidobacteraceae bacterium]
MRYKRDVLALALACRTPAGGFAPRPSRYRSNGVPLETHIVRMCSVASAADTAAVKTKPNTAFFVRDLMLSHRERGILRMMLGIVGLRLFGTLGMSLLGVFVCKTL